MPTPQDALIRELHRSGVPAAIAQQRAVDDVCGEFGSNPTLLAIEVVRLRAALEEFGSNENSLMVTEWTRQRALKVLAHPR